MAFMGEETAGGEGKDEIVDKVDKKYIKSWGKVYKI